jgi:hypothetical protein
MRRLIFLCVVAAGCNAPTYLFQNRPLETVAPAMGMGAFGDDTDLYVVPVRVPTPEEMQALADEQTSLGLPQPIPWVGLRDFDIEIVWSLKNLENQRTQAFVTVNGGNEFGDFDPALYVDVTLDEEDQQPPPSLLGGSPIDLGPNEVKSGVFREDQVRESATDLEAITRYPVAGDPVATAFQTLLRHSSASRTGLDAMPDAVIVPAWVRFAFRLSSAGHVVFDYTVRVRDRSGKLARPTDMPLYISTAATLPPAVPPAFMPMP